MIPFLSTVCQGKQTNCFESTFRSCGYDIILATKMLREPNLQRNVLARDPHVMHFGLPSPAPEDPVLSLMIHICIPAYLSTYIPTWCPQTNHQHNINYENAQTHTHTQVQTCCNTSGFHTFASFPGLSWIGLPMPGIPRRMLLMLWEVGSSLTKHTFGATGKYQNTQPFPASTS